MPGLPDADKECRADQTQNGGIDPRRLMPQREKFPAGRPENWRIASGARPVAWMCKHGYAIVRHSSLANSKYAP